jgi:hypothetical protein
MEEAPKQDGAGAAIPAKAELPTVESPSISPATKVQAAFEFEPVSEPVVAAPAAEPVTMEAAPANPPRFVLRPRHKRYALLAASVTLAAALGAVVGALATGGHSAPAAPDVAAIEQNKAMQVSIARLGREVTTLRASLDQANKAAHTQIAKISERLEHATAEITGSIAAPQTTAPATAPLPARVPVVTNWTIRDTRNGYVYVENHGAVYQVQLGAPLPGLGPVQSVKRQDGRWTVLTPKGIIVSLRDRRYFEQF